MNKRTIMKNIFILLFACLAITLQAQKSTEFVEVTYELRMDMDAETVIQNVPQQYRAQVADQIRQELADGIKINYILKTNGQESTYEMVEKISNAQSPVGMITQQIMSQDKGVFYKDLKEGTFLKPYDVMGTKYLVKDKLPEYTWEITRENEEIAGFNTRKAMGQYNDTISAKAWFTPKITIKDGPDRTWGLPGLILKSEFNTNGVDISVTAISVVVRDEEIKITKPSGGKQLTQEAFEKEMLEMQKKFQEMMGGGVDTE